MKKRILSFILTAVFVLSALPAIPAFAGTAWDGIEQTEPILKDGAYQISNTAELAWFADATKTDGTINAVLTADVDLNGKEWSPIGIPASGYITEAFSGTFDGQGHTVSNVKIDTDQAFYGLFYCVYGGTVKNLSVKGNVSTTGNTAGGIVGKLQGGAVENCSFDGTVSASKNYVGGIVGNIVSNSKAASTIIGCCNNGEISGKYAGGILGYTTAKANISHCYNTGTINGTTRGAGISGQQSTGSISYCYNIGSSANGIYGFSNAAITACYYLNDETAAPGGAAVPTNYGKIMEKAALLDALNAGDNKLFCEDTKNKNDGYPILNWQNKLTPEEEAAEQKKKEDNEKVKNALEELTVDTNTIKEKCILKLPSKIGDCSIEWTSSNTDIISNKGVVTLPDKNIVNVTLTAKITYGEISDSKDFTISVWSENIDAELYLQSVLDAMEWNFEQLQPVYGQDSNMIVKFQNLLKSKGFDGITTTMKDVSDESLISKTGKIFYPAIDKESFADGKQIEIYFNLSFNETTVTYPAETDKYSLLIPWDTSSVKEKLEQSADHMLSETIIGNSNASLSNVSTDLNLPSNIGRNEGKFSFAWVTWESSDNTHISISDENRGGSADALYHSYIGKIHQDGEEHTVTLTATIKNPSTDVAIQRTFIVTVAPLSDEKLNQTLDKMNDILSCYTTDKLTDSATKKQLNINSVDNDIQLVIPRNVVTADELKKLDYGKYWDYWNYKFSVTSSDTDVIEINSFRAFVYRPLGEDASADKKVTLTVKMESKVNPNLFVTKNIDVTVKHLSREDMNAQLDLMDRAKDNYASGLLGSNADTYSIIDNLSPYQEIIWNKDKTGIDFVRTHSAIQGNGIIVDTLPGWEEQEDWRLFRTSDKDLISNETLILNKTPDDNTFVKINSVLTDEALGKYYNKFKDVKGFDEEALIKFKQLYKQPVSAYVMVVGKDKYTDKFAVMTADSKAKIYGAGLLEFKKELDKPITITFTLLGLDGVSMIAETTETSFTTGATVFDVFKKVLADNQMSYKAKGSYISSINGLAERDHGGGSGWMYAVAHYNLKDKKYDKYTYANSYMNAQELRDKDKIRVVYVRNYQDANKQLENNQNSNTDDKNHTSNNSGNSNNNKDNQPNASNNHNSSSNNSKSNQSKNQSNDNTDDSSNSAANKTVSESISDESSNAVSNSNSHQNENADQADNNADIITASLIKDSDNNNQNSVVMNDSMNQNTENNKNWKIVITATIGAVFLIFIIVFIALKNRKKNDH